MPKSITLFVSLALVATVSSVLANPLRIEVAGGRTRLDIDRTIDQTGLRLAKNLQTLTDRPYQDRLRAGRGTASIRPVFPKSAELTINGEPLRSTFSNAPDITLRFESTGSRSFSPAYRDRLQGVLTTARPILNAVFGQPASGGPIWVRNYNLDIADRAAVVGGLYVHNGTGGPEIRFPVYNNPETVAVNFIHCLLLAYLGPKSYGFDAFQEGIVRAAVMRIVRTPSALPTYDQVQIENVLAATYDIGPTYDWLNQRALSGPRFIAPNLANTTLPVGGSVGGLYLLRHMMAGSAWQKVAIEDPGFIAAFNQAYYARPTFRSNVPKLVELAQFVLNQRRPEEPRVEGLAFAQWFARQQVLDTTLTLGNKLLVEAIPITSGLARQDFGVFIVAGHYFRTLSNGNEELLAGLSFPMFWEGSESPNRFSPSSQDDRIDIFGAYGSVGPNLTNLYGNVPYRTAIDLPIDNMVARVYVPAGAIATATRPTASTFYGTLLASDVRETDAWSVVVRSGNTQLFSVPVNRGAFGTRQTAASYINPGRLTIQVIRRRNGINTLMLSRRVNKPVGALALDLRVGGDITYRLPGGLPRGIDMVGLPVQPQQSELSKLLGISANQVLAARYQSLRGAFELYPTFASADQGTGFYVRTETAKVLEIVGKTDPGVSKTISLRPGWNMISPPILGNTPTTLVRVVKAAEFPVGWAEAIGTDIGTDFFEFRRSSVNDPATGAPEVGTLLPASQFVAGRAYFVRVLAAEGVSLSFDTAVSERASSRAASNVPLTWQARVGVSNGQDRSWVLIGASSTATRYFEPSQDSGAPPGLGGLQVMVENRYDLFRDTRRTGSAERFRLRVEGLLPGQNYVLKVEPRLGSLPRMQYLDSLRGIQRPIAPNGTIAFRARAETEWHEIAVQGRGQ